LSIIISDAMCITNGCQGADLMGDEVIVKLPLMSIVVDFV
jgi:hypothetical protein